jgi:hypothetical protein
MQRVMTVIDRHGTPDPTTEPLIEAAARDGFALVQYETTTGQVVWEWRRGDEPRPQFVTRRVALVWMEEWLGHSA